MTSYFGGIMKKGQAFLVLFFMCEILLVSLQTIGLHQLYMERPKETLGFYVFIVFIFIIFSILVYVYHLLWFGQTKIHVRYSFETILVIHFLVQLVALLLVKEYHFTLLSLDSLFLSLYTYFFLHLKITLDKTPFDLRKSYFEQLKLTEIIFDYGYLALFGIVFKFPSVLTIIGSMVVLSLFLILDYYLTLHTARIK